jgi:hypothetical protein
VGLGWYGSTAWRIDGSSRSIWDRAEDPALDSMLVLMRINKDWRCSNSLNRGQARLGFATPVVTLVVMGLW